MLISWSGLKRRVLAAVLLFPLLGLPAMAIEGVSERTVEAAFADVAQDVSDAIINRGYTVDHKSFIGDMLKRTGPSVGSDKVIYKNAELVQFCSAVLSRNMMEADAANIAFCPYVIFYYERADKPGTVHVGFRRMSEQGSDQSKAATKAINDLLDEVIKEATGG